MPIHPTAKIHPTAIIDETADIAGNVEIGPLTVIGAQVEIGKGSTINSHVVIKGPTKIGKHNRIFQFSSVGEECQDLKYKGELTSLHIGDDNVIREGCTIHRGTVQDLGITRIGSGNLLMAYVHVAHDCIIDDQCILANNSSLAGHVKVGTGAIFGGFTIVHQFCQVGAYTMSAGNTTILKDVPAFVMSTGTPARACGMNLEGMKRRDYPKEVIRLLSKAYRIVFRSGLTLADALKELEDFPKAEQLETFIQSLKTSERGIIRGVR